MVAPVFTPVTTPVDPTTVATEITELLHVPPGIASDKVMVLPWQTAVAPVINANGFTVTVMVLAHPPAMV